ncbi:K(+)-stimulated pyrophosphate-energized sodium pump [Nymphon striatum]|nr:K(+)-stimulated pyrophosphate-energized sodium pump [Nymphon striatum]
MSMSALFPILLGVFGLYGAFYLFKEVKRYPGGEDKIRKNCRANSSWCNDLGWKTALSFLIGACTSALAGYIGMFTATKANVRTAVAASNEGVTSALTVAFFGGSIMGLTVASMGLLGLGFLYLIFGGNPETAHVIHGFGMGASSVALFSRVGGGIFTKSADVGADLVGKGDVAGMGSDIFESYCGSIIATIALASTMAATTLTQLNASQDQLMFLPLVLASFGLICSMIGIFLVKQSANKSPEVALRTGTIGASVLFILIALILIAVMGVSLKVWGAVLVGAVGGIIIGLITEYYTSGSPVKKVAKAGETGPATVMIAGLSVGMQSVVIPVLTICGIILISSNLSGLYGVAISAVGYVSNDELGNTTAAIGKGFAIGAAALAALAIISAYIETISHHQNDFSLQINDPLVLAGMFLGGIFPFVISAITMNAVGEAAFDMIKEIRRQFKDIPGLLEGTAEPDTERCFLLGPQALGGMLGGALICCVLLALTMANAGGVWDNAKKYVEKGNLGGKGSETHVAVVVGDTVG